MADPHVITQQWVAGGFKLFGDRLFISLPHEGLAVLVLKGDRSVDQLVVLVEGRPYSDHIDLRNINLFFRAVLV